MQDHLVCAALCDLIFIESEKRFLDNQLLSFFLYLQFLNFHCLHYAVLFAKGVVGDEAEFFGDIQGDFPFQRRFFHNAYRPLADGVVQAVAAVYQRLQGDFYVSIFQYRSM